MSEEKRYPPSEYKLLQLRRLGIIPVSRQLNNAAIVCGLMASGLWLYLTKMEMILELAKRGFAGGLIRSSELPHLSVSTATQQSNIMPLITIAQDLLGPMLNALAAMLVLTIAVTLCTKLAIGLFQTRFFFSLRLFNFSPPGLAFLAPAKFLSGVAETVAQSSLLVLWFGVLFWAINAMFLPLCSTLSGGYWNTLQPDLANAMRAVGTLSRVLAWLSIAAVIFVAIVGVISRWIAVILFHRANMMTRGEVEAESRETELSPAMRRAVNQAGNQAGMADDWSE